jgi:TRAP-type C4-dicarboxylate transport system permease small subunit
MGSRTRAAFEWAMLIAGLGLALYLAWFAARAVWLSYITHDVSPAADATPLWIPQLCMAIGCAAFALAFLDAIVARWRGREWFIAGPGSVAE